MLKGESGGPTVRLLALGRQLRELREDAGRSIEDAARALRVSPATIRRMEQGQVKWKIPYLRVLLETYGVPHDQADAFTETAEEANRPGWWYRYRDVLPPWFMAYVSLESEAGILRAYEPHYVPGLLQTEDYARAVLRAGAPTAAESEVERKVAVRLERQKLLDRPDGPQLWCVMDETVLRRPMVPSEVMAAQIEHLVEAASNRLITLQVIPFTLCIHEGMYGPFHLFRFPQPELQDVAYIENLHGAVYLDQYEDVAAFQEALDRISAQALSPSRTATLLRRIRREFL